MSIVACGLPAGSELSAGINKRADFRDAYRAPLRLTDLGVEEIFAAIFARRPFWMTAALVARNAAAAFVGLQAPKASEMLKFEPRDSYSVGEKIGPWPIFFLGEDELVAGRDNAHMDFRVSVMKVRDSGGASVVISTVCAVHNQFGRHYLSTVIPFHKFGVRKLMANAVAAQRL